MGKIYNLQITMIGELVSKGMGWREWAWDEQLWGPLGVLTGIIK